jgi:hypothetical protein
VATLEFKNVEKVILVKAPDTEVSIQELYDKSVDWLDEPNNLWVDNFVLAEGKAALGATEFTGVTLTLIDDWRVQFEDRGGPATESMIISGGNLVAVNVYDDNPIKPSLYTQVQIRQSQAPTLLVVSGGVGTPEEVADAVWDAQESDHTDTGSFGARMRKLLTKALFLGLSR